MLVLLHAVLKNKKPIQKWGEQMFNAISDSVIFVKGSRRATVFIPKGTKFVINDVLLSSKSRRNLFKF